MPDPFSAIGVLLEPRPCDIPGASSFKGAIFHSAKWNHDVDLTGKNVVVIGNGCTAAQIVAAIVNKVKSVTQVIRTQHWTEFGGPEGYNCSVMHGFPNFFLLLGSNSITGHTSAIMAIENSINYAFRILKPVFQEEATAVEIKKEAEDSYVSWMQSALQNTVWNTGCQSWYVSTNKQWNAIAYPRSQLHYWYRSLFPVWTDWNIEMKPSRKSYKGRCILALLTTGALAAVGSLTVLHFPTPSLETYVSRIPDLLLDLPLESWQSTMRNVTEYIPKVGWW
ncbi:hypothetical protein MAP00_008070 [Monascus purpureus]|nr:hypothetical protein MAP00_008070 [Monascus purpureus]